jgi:hypothetical protein
MPLTYIKNEQGEFICPHEGCKFTSKNQSTTHYHLKKHLEELNYTCKYCKKTFLQKQTLELHIRSKHPEQSKSLDLKKFYCPFDNCEFSSLTKGNTIIHCLRVHFQTEIRDLMFNSEDNIKCKECDTEFNSTCAFFYHAKKCLHFDNQNEKHQKFKEIIVS